MHGNWRECPELQKIAEDVEFNTNGVLGDTTVGLRRRISLADDGWNEVFVFVYVLDACK